MLQLDKLLIGSTALRKLAASPGRSSARLVGAGLQLGKKFVKGVGRKMMKHKRLTAVGLLGAASIPSGVRKWKQTQAQTSQLSPQNIARSSFWER